MARFYADIKGSRGESTGLGTKASSITSHTRGWDVGVRVTCRVNENGDDECLVYVTDGSNGSRERHVITVDAVGICYY